MHLNLKMLKKIKIKYIILNLAVSELNFELEKLRSKHY